MFNRYIVSMGLLITGQAYSGTLTSIDFGKDSDGNTQVQFLGNDIKNVSTFDMNSPNAIVLDFIGVNNELINNVIDINNTKVSKIVVVEGENKTRATLSLNKLGKYKLETNNNVVTLVFPKANSTYSNLPNKSKPESGIVNFSGENGKGVLSIKSSSKLFVDLDKQGKKVVANISGAKLARSQIRRMNVLDFNTPINYIDVFSGKIVFNTNGKYEVTSYQSNGLTKIEFSKPVEKENQYEKELMFSAKREYKGTPMSLNFQQIDVRAVIQLVADYTNRNIVVSDEVTGNITLRLNEVPSDQVLETILKTKGLSMREVNGVAYIAPTTTLVTQETTELEGLMKREELSPLRTENITVNYARAEDIAAIIKSSQSTGKEGSAGSSGFLSGRGSISVDKRTNTIIIQDVVNKIADVRAQISMLDKAVEQVMVSARLVTASDSFKHELGVRLGGSFIAKSDGGVIGASGSANGANSILTSAVNNVRTTGQAFPANTGSYGQRLGVNLGSSNPSGSIGLGILGANYLIDLELSAMNEEGRGEIISNQNVMTQDGALANITQGTQWPYTTIDDKGKVTIAFKDIVMSLDVTPKITPNKMVDLQIKLDKDTVGALVNGPGGQVPVVNINKITTQVLVENGQTVVLGGVYEQQRTKSESKVPLLGDLPAVGRLFRKDTNTTEKDELLIFVTPQIVSNRYLSNDKFSTIRN